MVVVVVAVVEMKSFYKYTGTVPVEPEKFELSVLRLLWWWWWLLLAFGASVVGC